MRRRDVLAGAGSLAVGATGTFPAPAIAQGIRQLKMVTDWPEDMPGLQTSAVRFAQAIDSATGGRIKIEVFPAGALVRPFETFDAVSGGVADMYHSFEGYFERKSQALQFFGAIPFGFTADELFAWVQYGGGQELWDALCAQFNVKSLLCTSTGCQMGGWFVREVNSPESYKGLCYRMGGPGAEVLRRMGAIVVTLPGGEIMSALQSGAIDASEWIGPWLDMAIGLHKAAGFYYYPAFHEPGSGFSLGIASARISVNASSNMLRGGGRIQQRYVGSHTRLRRRLQDMHAAELPSERRAARNYLQQDEIRFAARQDEGDHCEWG
jgi:TRAP-type mannitol/chloroaromatic compound transport system substrate-binding protein